MRRPELAISDARDPKPREFTEDLQVVEFGAIGPFPELPRVPPEANPVVKSAFIAQHESLKTAEGEVGSEHRLCAPENHRDTLKGSVFREGLGIFTSLLPSSG